MYTIGPLLVAISLTLVASTPQLDQEDQPFYPETSGGILGVLKDLYHQPDKYVTYFKLFLNVFFDYLERLKESAVLKQHKIMNRLKGYGIKHQEPSFRTLGGKLDPEVEQQVRALIQAISGHMAEFLPTETELPEMDYKLPLGYICGVNGKIYNLKSIKRRTTVLKADKKQDSLHINILFHFDDLHVYYERFLERTSALRVRRGRLRIDFDDNEVSVRLKVPSITNVLDRVFKMECIFNVESIELVRLDTPNVAIETNGLLRGHFSKFVAKEGIRLTMPSLINSANESIEELLMDSLDTSGWWVCRNERKHIKPPEVPFTKYFNRYCRQEYYWY